MADRWARRTRRIRRALLREFGTPVLYYPKTLGGGSVSLVGVFSAPYVEIDVGAEAAITSTKPTLGIDLDDLPGAPGIGDRLVRSGVDYLVADVRPDGEGWMELALHLS